jgi:hypothetical protein
MTIKKVGKGPTENRAGSVACGQKVFSVLTFWFFCVKTKELAPAAMSGQNVLLKRKFVILRNEESVK